MLSSFNIIHDVNSCKFRKNCFSNTAIKSMKLHQGSNVEAYAFSGCSSLESITIEDSCIVSYLSFNDCFSLREIRFSDNFILLDFIGNVNNSIKIYYTGNQKNDNYIDASIFLFLSRYYQRIHVPSRYKLDTFCTITAIKETKLSLLSSLRHINGKNISSKTTQTNMDNSINSKLKNNPIKYPKIKKYVSSLRDSAKTSQICELETLNHSKRSIKQSKQKISFVFALITRN